MDLLFSKELRDTILYYDEYLNGEVDPISIAAVILSKIAKSLGAETPQSLHDSLPRFYIIEELNDKLKEAKKYIECEDIEDVGDITDDYWAFIGEELADDYETLEERGDGYDSDIFYGAINKLKGAGYEIYITNWKKYERLVWDTYSEIKG